jgi:hypothetical protein
VPRADGASSLNGAASGLGVPTRDDFLESAYLEESLEEGFLRVTAHQPVDRPTPGRLERDTKVPSILSPLISPVKVVSISQLQSGSR